MTTLNLGEFKGTTSPFRRLRKAQVIETTVMFGSPRRMRVWRRNRVRYPLCERFCKYSCNPARQSFRSSRPSALNRALSSTEYAGRRAADLNAADVVGDRSALMPAIEKISRANSNQEQSPLAVM